MNPTPNNNPTHNHSSNSLSQGLRRSLPAVLRALPSRSAGSASRTAFRALPALALVLIFLFTSLLPALAADEADIPPATPNLEGLVIISDDVKTMDKNTITNRPLLRLNVRTVRVPKTVKKIKKGTFDNYPNLEKIEFYGKEKNLKLAEESIPEDVEVVFVNAKTSETSVWTSGTTKAGNKTTKADNKTTKSTTKSGSSNSGSGNRPSNGNSDLLAGGGNSNSSDSSSRRTTKSTTKTNSSNKTTKSTTKSNTTKSTAKSSTTKSTTKSNTTKSTAKSSTTKSTTKSNTTKSTTSSKTTKKSTTKSGTTKPSNSTTAGKSNASNSKASNSKASNSKASNSKASNSTTAGSGNKPTAASDDSAYTTNESQSRMISEMAKSWSQMAEQYAAEQQVATPYNVNEEVDLEEDPIEGSIEDAEDPMSAEELAALEAGMDPDDLEAGGKAAGDLLLDEDGNPILDENGNPVHAALASYDAADRHVRDVSYVVTGAAGLSAVVLFFLKFRQH